MTVCLDTFDDSATQRTDLSEVDDNTLLNLIKERGDRRALAELYDRYRSPVGHFLRRKMCDPKLIDEVYNDVMLTVWQKAASFRGDSKVSTWIFGIAFRTRQTHSRKENRHNHVGSDELLTNIESEDFTDSENRNSMRDSVHAAMSSLSEQHREVIELAYFHGYSTQEISQIADCPQNTVKTRLFHARKNLKAVLEAEQAVDVQPTSQQHTHERDVQQTESTQHRSQPLFFETALP